MSLKSLVELDEQVETGSYKPKEEFLSTVVENYTGNYNPMEEMKKMKDSGVITEDVIKNSKLPKEIIDSFVSKPSIVNEDLMYKAMGGSSVETLEQKSGWSDRVREINNKVIGGEKTKIRESSSPYTEPASEVLRAYSQTGNNTTESILLQVLDRLHKIEEKLDEIETIGFGSNDLKVFQITNGGEFMFLDSDGNVYKAELEYKGKKKQK